MARTKGKKLLVAGLCAATLAGGMVSMSAPAEAWHRGYSHGYAPGYAYRPYRRSGRNAAIAAGVVGGLALGAIAAGAARPVYAAPVRECYQVRRDYIDAWGRRFSQYETVC
jgi:hypothetical protein